MQTETTRIVTMTDAERTMVNLLTPQERKDALVQAATVKYRRVQQELLYRPGNIVINVANGQALVSRIRESSGGITLEQAVNANELEEAAAAVIAALGSTTARSGQYPCPPELAARAEWK